MEFKKYIYIYKKYIFVNIFLKRSYTHGTEQLHDMSLEQFLFQRAGTRDKWGLPLRRCGKHGASSPGRLHTWTASLVWGHSHPLSFPFHTYL